MEKIICLAIKGKLLEKDLDKDLTLRWFLPYKSGLTGTGHTCGMRFCGACMVLFDAEAAIDTVKNTGCVEENLISINIKNSYMKTEKANAFVKSKKTIRGLLSLLLCFILIFNISGQNLQMILGESWSGTNWQNSTKQIFTYDVNNFLTNLLSQTWDVPSLSWINSTQSNYTNNPDGTKSQVISQTWDDVMSVWNDQTRTTYTYNLSGKVLTEVSELWLGAIWQNSSRQTNTYDGSGFLTVELTETWDFIGNNWKNSSQTLYTNNPDGTASQEIIQQWDGISTWTNFQRISYTYNLAKKVLTEVTDDWSAGVWQVHSMETNTYDVSGYLTIDLFQLWDIGSTSWINSTQTVYTNNTDGTPDVSVDQSWDAGLSSWNNTLRLTFTFTSTTGMYELAKDENYTIYPNPASDIISVKSLKNPQLSTYYLKDQSGKQVLQGKITGQTTGINISLLANGIYFLQIGEKRQHIYKVIINQSK